MKKIILINLLLLFAFFTGLAQMVTIQITGTVTDVNGGAGVANQTVFIMSDSVPGGTFFYYNQVYTDNQGVYLDAVSVPQNAQIIFYIGTVDCNGNYVMQTGVSTNAPIIANFTICTGGSSTCDAMFYAVPDSLNPSGSLTWNFYDASFGNPVTWNWSFGDGTTSTLQNPSHTYAQPGVYMVCLTIATGSGCTSTFCDSIWAGQVFPFCAAHFTVATNPSSNQVMFYDLSTGNPTTWQWSFGDGTGSNQQNPVHTYNAPGYYNVCLTILGNNCQDTYCSYIFVQGGGGCMADFYPVPDSNAGGTTVSFYDMSWGSVISWNWTFGDGGTSTQQNPVHTYNAQGFYNVCLTIFTSDSCTSIFCDTVYAGTIVIPCSAYASFMPNGLTVDFFGYGWGGTPPYSFLWDFGDGTTSNLQNPTHAYAQAGTYTVTLTLADAAGCSSGYSMTITVSNQVPGTIWGQAFVNNTPLDNGMAFLYILTGGTNAMYLVDTTAIDTSGFYQFYMMNPLPGIYYVLVSPGPGSQYFATHMPTYYGDVIFWGQATPIYLNQSQPPYNIALQALVGPVAGPGNIGGQVNTGGPFVTITTTGNPVPGVEIILLNMGNDPLAMQISDDQGYFSFPNLAYGTYKVYAEVPGMPCTPAIVTLTSNAPSQPNIPVVITPSGIITGLDEAAGSVSVNRLYPNPVRTTATLEIGVETATTLEVTVLNMIGTRVFTGEYSLTSGMHRLELDLSTIGPGTYMLQLTPSDGPQKVRKITIVR